MLKAEDVSPFRCRWRCHADLPPSSLRPPVAFAEPTISAFGFAIFRLAALFHFCRAAVTPFVTLTTISRPLSLRERAQALPPAVLPPFPMPSH